MSDYSSDGSDDVSGDLDAFLNQIGGDDGSEDSDGRALQKSYSIGGGSVDDSQLLASLGIDIDAGDDDMSEESEGRGDDGGSTTDQAGGVGAPSGTAASVPDADASLATALSAEIDEHLRQARQESTLSAILHDDSDDESSSIPHPDDVEVRAIVTSGEAPHRSSDAARHRQQAIYYLDELTGVSDYPYGQGTPRANETRGADPASRHDSAAQDPMGWAEGATDADLLPPQVLETIRQSEAIVNRLEHDSEDAGGTAEAGDGAAETGAGGKESTRTSHSAWFQRSPLMRASETMRRLQAGEGARLISPFAEYFASLMLPPQAVAPPGVQGGLEVQTDPGIAARLAEGGSELLSVASDQIDSRGWLLASTGAAGGRGSEPSIETVGSTVGAVAPHPIDAPKPSAHIRSVPLRDVASILNRATFSSGAGRQYQARRYGRILCSAACGLVLVVGTSAGFALVFSWRGLSARQWYYLRPLCSKSAAATLKQSGGQLPTPVDVPGLCFSGEIDLRPRSEGAAGSAAVTSVAISKDGSELAAGLASGEVRLVSLRIETVSSSAQAFRQGPLTRKEQAVDVVVDVAGKPRAAVRGHHRGYILAMHFTHDGPDCSFDDCGRSLVGSAPPAAREKSALPELIAMCDGGVMVLYKLHESFLQSASLHPKILLDGSTRMRQAAFTPSCCDSVPAAWELERSAVAESRGVPVKQMRQLGYSGWLVSASSLDSTFIFRSRPKFEVQLRWDRPRGVSPLFAPSVAWGYASTMQVSSVRLDRTAGVPRAFEADGSRTTVVPKVLKQGLACTDPVLTVARAWGTCVQIVQVQPSDGYATEQNRDRVRGSKQADSRITASSAEAAASASSRAFAVGDGSSAEAAPLNFLLCADLRTDEPVVALEWLSSSRLLLVSCGSAALLNTQTMQVAERIGLSGLQLSSRPLPVPKQFRTQILQDAMLQHSRVVQEQKLKGSVGEGHTDDIIRIPKVFEGTPGEASVVAALAHLSFSGSVTIGRCSPIRVWGSDSELDGSRNYIVLVGTDSTTLLQLQSIPARCHGLVSTGDSIGAMALSLAFLRRADREGKLRQRLTLRLKRAAEAGDSRALPSAGLGGAMSGRLREYQAEFGQRRLAADILKLAPKQGLEAISASNPALFSRHSGLELASQCAHGLGVGRPSAHPCSRLARAAIDFAVGAGLAQQDGPLFRAVFEAFDASSWAQLFLIELEPYILHNSIEGMPASVVVAWINLYKYLGRGDILERCLLHLSARSHMDINLLVKVCVRLGLWAALVVVLSEVMKSGTSACDLLLLGGAPLLNFADPSEPESSKEETGDQRISRLAMQTHHRARIVLLHFMRQTLDARPFRSVDVHVDGLGASEFPSPGELVTTPGSIDLVAFRADFLAALCSSTSDGTFPDIDEALLSSLQASETIIDPSSSGLYDAASSREAASDRSTSAHAMVVQAAYEQVLSSFRESMRHLQDLPGPFKRLQACLLLDCRGLIRVLYIAVLPASVRAKIDAQPTAPQHGAFSSTSFPSNALDQKPIGVGGRVVEDVRILQWQSWCVNSAAIAELDIPGSTLDSTKHDQSSSGENRPGEIHEDAGAWSNLRGDGPGDRNTLHAANEGGELVDLDLSSHCEFPILPFEVATSSRDQVASTLSKVYQYLWRLVSRSTSTRRTSDAATTRESKPAASMGPSSGVVVRSLVDAGVMISSASAWATTGGYAQPQFEASASGSLAVDSLRVVDEDDFLCGLATLLLWLYTDQASKYPTADTTESRPHEAAKDTSETLDRIGFTEHSVAVVLGYLAASAVAAKGRASDVADMLPKSALERLESLRDAVVSYPKSKPVDDSKLRELLLCELIVLDLHTDETARNLEYLCAAGNLRRPVLLLAFSRGDISTCVQQYCLTTEAWRGRVFGFVRAWLWKTIREAAVAKDRYEELRGLLVEHAPGSDEHVRLSEEYQRVRQRAHRARQAEQESKAAILENLAQLVEISPKETTRLIVGLYPSERDSVLQVLGERQRLRFLRELLAAHKAAARLRGGDDIASDSPSARSSLVRETLLGRKEVADLLQMQDAAELTRDLHPRYLRLLCKLEPAAVRAFLESELEASGMASHAALDIVTELQVPDAIAYLYCGRGRRPDALNVLLSDMQATVGAIVEVARTRMAGGGRVSTRAFGEHASRKGRGSGPEHREGVNYTASDQSDALTVGFKSHETNRALQEADACIDEATDLVERLYRTSSYAVYLCREGSEIGSDQAGQALWFDLLDSMTSVSRKASEAGQRATSASERTAYLAAFRCVDSRLRDVLSGMQECLSLHVVLNKVLKYHGDAPYEQYRYLVSSIVSSARYDENYLRFASELVRADARESAYYLFVDLRTGSAARQVSAAPIVEARSEFLQAVADARAQLMGSKSRRGGIPGLQGGGRPQALHEPPLYRRYSTAGPGRNDGAGALPGFGVGTSEFRDYQHRKFGIIRQEVEMEQIDVESYVRRSGLARESTQLSLHARASQIDSSAISQGSLGIPAAELDAFSLRPSRTWARTGRKLQSARKRAQSMRGVRARGMSRAALGTAVDSDDSDAEQQQGPPARRRDPSRWTASSGTEAHRSRRDVSEFGRSQAAQRLMRSRAMRDSAHGLADLPGGSASGMADRLHLEHSKLLDSVYNVALSYAAPSALSQRSAGGPGIRGASRKQSRSIGLARSSVGPPQDLEPQIPLSFVPSAGSRPAEVQTSAIAAVDFAAARVALSVPR